MAKRKPYMVPVGGSPGAPKGQAVPSQSSSKAEIVAWLLAHGVSFTEAALFSLTVAELLSLVADLLDNP